MDYHIVDSDGARKPALLVYNHTMSGMDLIPNEPHALHGMTIDLSDEGNKLTIAGTVLDFIPAWRWWAWV